MLFSRCSRQQRLLQLLRQAAEASPVVGHRAAAVRDQEAQRRKLLEQVRREALHEGRRVGVQVMRAGGVKGRVAAGADVDHRRDVVLHHLLVDRVPVLVAQRGAGPVAARRIGIQVDADVAVLLDAFLQLGNAGGRIDAGRLRQHRHRHEIVGKELTHPVAQLVADRGPGRRHLEVADVVGHETGARREQRDVAAALLHQPQLVGLDRFAQLVVADLQVGRARHHARVLDACDLLVAPRFQRLGRRGVVAVAIDDHWLCS